MIIERTAIVCGLLTFGLAMSCFGDPPRFGQTEESAEIDQLRREVEELKQTVSALRTRLCQLEYPGLPQAIRSLPDGQLLEPASDGYLRFPIDVERANALPPRWNRRTSNR